MQWFSRYIQNVSMYWYRWFHRKCICTDIEKYQYSSLVSDALAKLHQKYFEKRIGLLQYIDVGIWLIENVSICWCGYILTITDTVSGFLYFFSHVKIALKILKMTSFRDFSLKKCEFCWEESKNNYFDLRKSTVKSLIVASATIFF